MNAPKITSSEQPLKPRISRNLSVRTISSMLLLPFVIYTIYYGGGLFAVLVLAMIAIGALEYAMMISHNHITINVIVCVVTAFVVAISFPMGWVAVGVAAIVLSAAVVVLDSQFRRKAAQTPDLTLQQVFIAWLLALYMGFVGAFGIMLRWHEAGLLWWMLIAASTWSMDTLSYAGGRAYGKRLLAPHLSPRKTVEGAVTGIIGAILIAMLFLIRLQAVTPLTVVLVVGAPFAALAGDLLESAVKRHFGVKDSHVPRLNIFPGHGGVLDRIDSLMTVIIYFFVVIAIVFRFS